MLNSLRFALLTMILGAGIVACSDNTVCACVIGPGTNVTGNYSGSIQDQVSGSGTAALSLTQNGSSVSGTITGTFSPTNTFTSNLSGSISGNTLSLTATPSNPGTGSCNYTLTGTANGSQITGSYSTVSGCTSPDSGTFSVTRR